MKKHILILLSFICSIISTQAFAVRLPDVSCLNNYYYYEGDQTEFEDFEELISKAFDHEIREIYPALERLNQQLNKIGRIFNSTYLEDISYIECYFNRNTRKIEVVVHNSNDYFECPIQLRINIVRNIFESSFEIVNHFFLGCLSHEDIVITIKGNKNEDKDEPILVIWENGNPMYKDEFFRNLKQVNGPGITLPFVY